MFLYIELKESQTNNMYFYKKRKETISKRKHEIENRMWFNKSRKCNFVQTGVGTTMTI